MIESDDFVINKTQDVIIDAKSPIEPYMNGKSFVETSFSITSNWDLDDNSTKGVQDSKAKKKVNICTDSPTTGEERRNSETSESCDKSSCVSNEKCLTMTGTIKRGKKAGQSLDVRLNISREELELMEANIAAKEQQKSQLCNLANGFHIFIFTLFCFPVAFFISSAYSFYMGTITWYSIFSYITEEKKLLLKICISPFVILLYPFFIVIFTVGLGLYAAFIQISWSFVSWQKEICDWEKGFYGWFCSVINLEECSPYEVVVLTDIKVTSDNDKCNSQDSILS